MSFKFVDSLILILGLTQLFTPCSKLKSEVNFVKKTLDLEIFFSKIKFPYIIRENVGVLTRC